MTTSNRMSAAPAAAAAAAAAPAAPAVSTPAGPAASGIKGSGFVRKSLQDLDWCNDADSSSEEEDEEDEGDETAGAAAGGGESAGADGGGGKKKKKKSKKKKGGAGASMDPAFPFAEARRRLVQVRRLPGRASLSHPAGLAHHPPPPPPPPVSPSFSRQVRTLPVKGRALVAATALPAGTLYFRERPYAAVVRCVRAGCVWAGPPLLPRPPTSYGRAPN